MYQWLVFAHIASVFVFLLAHGVSAAVVFRVRAEKDVATLRALLDLSALAVMVSFYSLAALLIAGIAAAFVGRWWGFGWPWAALAALVVIWFSMALETGPAMRRLRRAAGFSGPRQIIAAVKPEELAAAQATVRPWLSATIGGAGLLVILWLMTLKPF
ncbi:MAG TPA: hypothetical protein VFQ25_16020 [Ktedonobacterales bacterium]|nr:hypothetical protein [Ktedonobacterales bacterium]